MDSRGRTKKAASAGSDSVYDKSLPWKAKPEVSYHFNGILSSCFLFCFQKIYLVASLVCGCGLLTCY